MDHELASKLEDWRSRLTTISRNVMDLSESASVKAISARLREGGPSPRYSGVTAQRGAEALKNIEDLWLDYLLLARVVEDAADLARRDGIFRRTHDEVMQLLEGDSVELPAVHIPLPQRDLLTSAHKSERATMARVLEAMQNQFVQARDTLVTIVEAETHLKEDSSKLTNESEALKSRANTLGVPAVALTLPAKFAEEITADPLGCAQVLNRLQGELNNQRNLLDHIEKERVTLCEGMSSARAKLVELRELVAKAHAAIEETQLKISTPVTFASPLNQAEMVPLEEWLAKLDETAAQGHWDALRVGLRRWQTTCDAKLAAAQDCLNTNRKLLDERSDLRGRFDAFRVKLAALEKRGQPVRPELQRLIPKVEAVLKARPCDLAIARHQVAEFESFLLKRSSNSQDST